MASLAGAVASKGVMMAVRIAASRFFRDVHRGYSIMMAKREQDALPKSVEDALAAIKIEVGRNGQLTETVDRFLDALARELFFESLMTSAFYRLRDDDLRSTFVAFHNKYFPDATQDQSIGVYQELRRVSAAYLDFGLNGSPAYFLLKGSHEELNRVRAERATALGRVRRGGPPPLLTADQTLVGLYDERRLVAQEHAARFTGLVSIEFDADREKFVEALRRLKPWFFIADEDVGEIRQQYASAVRADTETLDVVSPRGRIEAQFDDLYVIPDLEAVQATYHPVTATQVEEARKQELKDQESKPTEVRPTAAGPRHAVAVERDDGAAEGRMASSPPPAERVIGPQALFEDQPHVVVLGHPGTGKTSVARYVVRHASRTEGDSFAVVIELRKYIVQKKSDARHNLTRHAQDKILATLPDLDEQLVRDAFLYTANFNRMVFVYDGLDEILNLSDRLSVSRELSAMARTFPRARHLLTSREIGYARNPVADWAHFRIRPFDQARIRAYVERATLRVLDVRPVERAEFISKFMDQVSKAEDLAKYPLLLALMTVLFKERGHHLPDQRHEIYEQCADLLFIKWDETREILPELTDRFRLSQLLCRLANAIYVSRELQAGVKRRWLEDFCAKFFLETFGGDVARAEKTGRDFAEYITDRAWVFTMTGADSFEFTHRTFLEYYYSLAVSEECEGLDDLLKHFRPLILTGQAVVVAHLCLQRYVHGSLPRSNRLAVALRKILQETRPEERTLAASIACDFISEAIDYIAPSESELRELVIYLTLYASDTERWRAALYRVLRRARDQKESVFAGVIEGLARASRHGAGRSLAAVYDYLYAVRLRRDGVMQSDGDLPPVIDELMDAITQRAEDAPVGADATGPAALKLKWDCYHADVDLYGMGLQPWESSVKLLGRADWLAIDIGVLLLKFSCGTFDAREARLFASLGDWAFRREPSLVRFSTDRRVIIGRIPGLDVEVLSKGLASASSPTIAGFIACLAILADYQELAGRSGAPGPARLQPGESLQALIDAGLERAIQLDCAVTADWVHALTQQTPRFCSTTPTGELVSMHSLISAQTLFPWQSDQQL